MGVYAKLAQVLGLIEEVPMTGKHSGFKFNYSTLDDLNGVIRPLLSQVSLALLPTVSAVERSEGKMVRAKMTFRLIDPVDGDAAESEFWGEADELSKAYTICKRQFLMATFMAGGSENEEKAEQSRPSKPAASPQRQAPIGPPTRPQGAPQPAPAATTGSGLPTGPTRPQTAPPAAQTQPDTDVKESPVTQEQIDGLLAAGKERGRNTFDLLLMCEDAAIAGREISSMGLLTQAEGGRLWHKLQQLPVEASNQTLAETPKTDPPKRPDGPRIGAGAVSTLKREAAACGLEGDTLCEQIGKWVGAQGPIPLEDLTQSEYSEAHRQLQLLKRVPMTGGAAGR